MEDAEERSSGAVSEDEEEGVESYCPGYFHPVRPGELYGNKYRVLLKLGYRQYSTFWLVRKEESVVSSRTRSAHSTKTPRTGQ